MHLKDGSGWPMVSVQETGRPQVQGLARKAGLRTRHNSTGVPLVATLAVGFSIRHPSVSIYGFKCTAPVKTYVHRLEVILQLLHRRTLHVRRGRHAFVFGHTR